MIITVADVLIIDNCHHQLRLIPSVVVNVEDVNIQPWKDFLATEEVALDEMKAFWLARKCPLMCLGLPVLLLILWLKTLVPLFQVV